MTPPALTVRTTTTTDVDPVQLSDRLCVTFLSFSAGRFSASVWTVPQPPPGHAYAAGPGERLASHTAETPEAALAGALEALRELHAAIGEALR